MSKIRASGPEAQDLEEVKKEITEMMKRNGISFDLVDQNPTIALENGLK